ncbi:MAG: hypothetical protein AAGF27_11795 [Pseudomonadota bacterium]
MRSLICLLLWASPVAAWEFTPGLPCVLTHIEGGAEVELTHDPRAPLYSITIRTFAPWPDADVFGIRFDGPAGITITTDRHVISPDGRALTVTDRGFGNVLNGLQQNVTATALLGDRAVPFSLAGADAPVDKFRRCEATPGV